MGLFKPKDPCPICGGKVPRLFPRKVAGVAICSQCHGTVDLPPGVEEEMSLEDFVQYMRFREQNQTLKDIFEVQGEMDFGWLSDKFFFDFDRQLLCFNKNLDTTIFEGSQIQSFGMYQDWSPLIECSRDGLIRYETTVPQQVRDMAPSLELYRAQRQMQREMERERERIEAEHPGSSTYTSAHTCVDIPEPFANFNIQINFDHPYWEKHVATMSGPRFDNDYPSAERYLRDYERDLETIGELAGALIQLAFPDVPEVEPHGAQRQERSGAAMDLRELKQLLDDGIITEAEFAAKKRQLLGI